VHQGLDPVAGPTGKPAARKACLVTPYKGAEEVPAPKEGKHILIEGKPKQCIKCLGNESKSYRERTFEFCNLNKMWDHVENEHLGFFAPDDDVACPHHYCKAKGFTSPSVVAFKRHCADYRKISLRPAKSCLR
jgi:hypothetical protein